MTDQDVYVLDIETSPMLVHVWNLKDQYVGLNQMVEDWHIMAWSAKKLGAPASEAVYYDLRHEKRGNDLPILRPLWRLLNKASIIITQNGKSFDAKKINARFMLHGMRPPSPYKHLDTFLIAKGIASFTSNSLEYLSERFCTKYKKLSHGRFPGLSLWTECLKGNMAAWKEMEKYNTHDVLATEELYMHIRAWAPVSAPKVYNAPSKCSTCGSATQRRGRELKGKTLVQRIRCKNPECGKWGTESIPKRAKK